MDPIKLSGGFTHKIYKVKTTSGNYAIKLLNPEIMKRSDAIDNFKLADQLEEKLLAAEIPIVPSLTFNNKKMQCLSGQYYYVFMFIDGHTLKPEQIKEEHCSIIGKLLARIHKIESTNTDVQKSEINIDWNNYIDLARIKDPSIAEILEQHKDLLFESQATGNESYKKLPHISCITNSDMDCKNVLWNGSNPFVIDLECLNYGNPFLELYELALCWCGYEECKIDFVLLKQFISSYLNEYGKYQIDWNVLYHSNNSRLLWLEYNVKRALLLECCDDDERLMGVEQVKETMKHIENYYCVKEKLINTLSDLF